MTSTIQLDSDLTCPACGHVERLRMPEDACLFFHPCSGCATLLRALPGTCCVFCSYGDTPCPPIQMDGHCGVACPPPLDDQQDGAA